MTVFTDPLGKERQGYIDEKVYGIPRRQVDYPSEFIPRPEVYVEPLIPDEEIRTPHVPSEPLPPLPTTMSHMGHEHHHMDETSNEHLPVAGHEDYTDSSAPYHNSHLHAPHEPSMLTSGVKYPSAATDMYTNCSSNGYNRDYNDHWSEQRDSAQYHDREYSRDHSNDDYHTFNDSAHYHSRGDHSDVGVGRYNRLPEPHDRLKHYDMHNELDGGPHEGIYDDDDSMGRDRDGQFTRVNATSRQGRDSDHHAVTHSSSLRHHQYVEDVGSVSGMDNSHITERMPLEPPGDEHRAQVESDMTLDPGGQTEEAVPEQSSASPESEAPPDPGTLDLDSRIKMMLNMNKDLAGFGAPEPVTVAPVEPAPPPTIMPLEPNVPLPNMNQMPYGSMTPINPLDPAFTGSKYYHTNHTL